jgi:putative transposase
VGHNKRGQSQFKYKLLEDIRQATNKGLALGNDNFFADIESLTGKRVIEGKRGRAVGWRKHKND